MADHTNTLPETNIATNWKMKFLLGCPILMGVFLEVSLQKFLAHTWGNSLNSKLLRYFLTDTH